MTITPPQLPLLARLAGWHRQKSLSFLEPSYTVPALFFDGKIDLKITGVPNSGATVGFNLVDNAGNVVWSLPSPTPCNAVYSDGSTVLAGFDIPAWILAKTTYLLQFFYYLQGQPIGGAVAYATGAQLQPSTNGNLGVAIAWPADVSIGTYFTIQLLNADGTKWTGGGSVIVTISTNGTAVNEVDGLQLKVDANGFATYSNPNLILAGGLTLAVSVSANYVPATEYFPNASWNLTAAQVGTSPGFSGSLQLAPVPPGGG